ncbi:antibiotic biosynthesis monooxygenase [Nonomuraea sp. NEAU-A123]|nr:putative quinol monooxygenase [Nonomuraea sp. NEAU-A123]MBT2234737.1 antibiotic biosynthesis monooxygenase [Nonomuraea sp. NEAU-A123]
MAVTVDPRHLERARRMFAALAEASRRIPGVINFDILQDPDDPHRFVSIEVYADEDAVDRQGKLPQLHAVMAAFPTVLSAGPEGRKFVVSDSEPWPS